MAVLRLTRPLSIPGTYDEIAVVVGNDMHDNGYQCCDMHPYFRFSAAFYTRYHPNNVPEAMSVPVYEMEAVIVDALEYDGMKQIGVATQNGASITYDGSTYEVDGNDYVSIREHLVNKWSRIKPVQADGLDDITASQWSRVDFGGRRIGTTRWGLEVPDITDLGYAKMEKATYPYVGLPQLGAAQWKRLADFDGYSHDAVCTFYGEVGAKVVSNTIYAALNLITDVNAVDFNELAKSGDLNQKPIAELYPAMVVRSVNGTDRYMQLMYPSSLASKTPTPLGTMTAQWAVSIADCPVAKNDSLLVCIFLVDKYDDLPSVSVNGSVGTIRNWLKLDGSTYSGMTFGQFLAVPDAVSRIVEITVDELYQFTFAGALWLRTSGVTLMFSTSGQTTEGYTYYVSLQPAGGVPVAKQIAMVGTSLSMKWSNSEIGFVSPTAGQTATLSYTVYAMKGGQRTTIIQPTEITLTAQ